VKRLTTLVVGLLLLGPPCYAQQTARSLAGAVEQHLTLSTDWSRARWLETARLLQLAPEAGDDNWWHVERADGQVRVAVFIDNGGQVGSHAFIVQFYPVKPITMADAVFRWLVEQKSYIVRDDGDRLTINQPDRQFDRSSHTGTLSQSWTIGADGVIHRTITGISWVPKVR
jgi:hypothetical protein